MADNINQHQYANKKVQAQQKAQQKIVTRGKLVEETYRDVKKREGDGKKDRPFLAYTDDTGARTIGNGINMDAPHNEKFLRDRVTDAEYAAMYNGTMKIPESLNEEAVRYNIRLALDLAEGTINNFHDMPYDVMLLSTDMYYNLGNVKAKMPNFNKALNEKDYHQASLELKYHNPSKDLERTTGYYQDTGDRAKEHFNTLNKYPRIEKVKERNELIFHFED
jgi:GH24 family phage-related lysozyme (muramidase)